MHCLFISFFNLPRKKLLNKVCLIILINFLTLTLANDKVFSRNKPKADLPNFHKVHSYLYRGGEPTEKGMNKLKSLDINYIIDLRHKTLKSKKEAKEARALGIEYLNLPMDSSAPTKAEVDTFMDTVTKAYDNHQKVYVHCAHGSDRTGCMVGIWRVTKDGLSYKQAYKEMRKYYFSPKFTNLSNTVLKYSK